MLKDPLWQDDAFPYRALEEAGVTPDSSMREVRDANFSLIEQGLWTLEKRLAWDELRIVERRLWVDFLLYPFDASEILDAIREVGQVLPEDAAGMSAALLPDYSELERMETDFRPLSATDTRPRRLAEFESGVDLLEGIKFDE